MIPSLEQVQRWMQSVVTHPGGVKTALESDDANSHFSVPPSAVEDIIGRSQAQSSVERLEIYSKAYIARLMECLEAEFPVFRQTVGEDVFAEFGIGYLQAYPSNSYTLGALGSKFPQFLQETRPVAPSNDTNSDWPNFLIDLARLERTFSEVFDSPGLEGKPPLDASHLQSLSPDEWERAKLIVAPCVRLLKFSFPVNTYYTAVKRGETPGIPTSRTSWLAVTRRNYVVRRYELNEAQFALLEAIQQGAAVGAAISASAAHYDNSTDKLAADLRQWFATWTAAPMFEAVATEANY